MVPRLRGRVTAATLTTAVIDLHAHLLPGIDDGPRTIAESVAMARVATANGIRTLVCTPHIHRAYPDNTPESIREGMGAVRQALEREGIGLEILPGGEISLDRVDRLEEGDLRALSLGGNGTWLLLELPFQGWPLALPGILGDLEIRGFRVVLAHPERAESIQRAPDRVRDLVGRGALLQVTAGSFTGEHGPRARRCALALLRGGVAHLLASDAHSAGWRPPALREGLERAAAALRRQPEDLVWSVEEGPRRVIEGGPVRPPKLSPGARRPVAAPRAAPGRPRSPRG
jgi:protein-tyrosine phosphatase